MNTYIGLGIVFACVLGGFAMAGGPFGVLIQPAELVVIGGAAFGALWVSAPGRVRKRLFKSLKHGFKPDLPSKEDYADLLKLLGELFQIMRREGVLALETHTANPESSPVFSKYPSFLKRERAKQFLIDSARQLVDGCSAHDLAVLLEAELETYHEEEHEPVGLIKSTGDALPGLGIVAAVLGIIVTMGSLGDGPEAIGHHVAAALVGTFLGILLSYGVIGPVATSIEIQGAADTRYLRAIREGMLAAARGAVPALAIEFARRALFSDERPTGEEAGARSGS